MTKTPYYVCHAVGVYCLQISIINKRKSQRVQFIFKQIIIFMFASHKLKISLFALWKFSDLNLEVVDYIESLGIEELFFYLNCGAANSLHNYNLQKTLQNAKIHFLFNYRFLHHQPFQFNSFCKFSTVPVFLHFRSFIIMVRWKWRTSPFDVAASFSPCASWTELLHIYSSISSKVIRN